MNDVLASLCLYWARFRPSSSKKSRTRPISQIHRHTRLLTALLAKRFDIERHSADRQDGSLDTDQDSVYPRIACTPGWTMAWIGNDAGRPSAPRARRRVLSHDAINSPCRDQQLGARTRRDRKPIGHDTADQQLRAPAGHDRRGRHPLPAACPMRQAPRLRVHPGSPATREYEPPHWRSDATSSGILS
jgi:hypothetical protein